MRALHQCAITAAALAAAVVLSAPDRALSAEVGASRDPRIRYIAYNKDRVTVIPTALGVSTMIQLGPDEVVETVSAGDTKAWSIVPKRGSGILFVKPLEASAETNINLVTNRRVYALVLTATEDARARSAFQVRFRYPEDAVTAAALRAAEGSTRLPNLRGLNPATINYDYAFKGPDHLKPRVAFDNGVKTFLQFSGEVPAIFVVTGEGKESLVNFRREGEYLVIDKVAAQFTLRAGDQALCLYNRRAGESRPDAVADIYGPKPVATGLFGLGAR